MNVMVKRFGTRQIMVTFSSPDRETVRRMLDSLQGADVEIDSYNMKPQEEGERKLLTVTIEMKIKAGRLSAPHHGLYARVQRSERGKH